MFFQQLLLQAPMANWACLPHDLLVFTAGLLKKFEDFAAFGTVCKTWHAAANKDYFKELWLRECTPYLLLPSRRNGNDEIRDLLSWSERDVVASVRVSNSSKRKCFESLGWLLAIEEDGSMCLLDPFSKVEIPLPHLSNFGEQVIGYGKPFAYVRKMVLSARPGESPNYTVVIIYRCPSDLAFWRPGETSWCIVETDNGFYQDLTYHSGCFYTFANETGIRIYNFVEGNLPESRVMTADHPSDLRTELFAPCSKNIYITNVEDSLLVVSRVYAKYYRKTIKFKVFGFNLSLNSWREVDNLGNMAIFVSSLNATTAVDASRFPGVIKANHIYFMDDANLCELDCYFEGVSGEDMGIYNMENGTIAPFYLKEKSDSIISRPTWFIPISWPLSC